MTKRLGDEVTETDRFAAAIERIDAANRDDPNLEFHKSRYHPKELLYAQRMTQWLQRFAPDALEAVGLAARAQHICRWKIRRSEYPHNRQGYRKWRSELGRFHAQMTSTILRDVGYDEPTIEHVQSLLRKERLKSDPDCQLLEDVICLVFLEHYAPQFVKEHDEAKLLNIFRRTLAKMSDRGRQTTLAMSLDPSVTVIIDKVGKILTGPK